MIQTWNIAFASARMLKKVWVTFDKIGVLSTCKKTSFGKRHSLVFPQGLVMLRVIK